ncbi:protein phosphatase 1B-like isoform X1 [Schistocerca gregaria]|uniref:protein phosphatase 1B-like isoform X1 n=1 Tax=Schistocerca gregaria TaxID=7010 RepID=UPI00211E3B59|nr:protein phosphatase 1B-like isoform X1 [Schistocerca gregaria]XP_049828195.1 protein phosphatase 1B-like isoform X1 [Schistocerca gregaria]XP_049828196.1 protein phosphatase 1B-like isoform X1 [Schistocerca gregaria]XP_049828197.1 protein phosphatase 1B-like isoform X1 [Schistocerca gregaria]XP_049828198.1 protein phosphatase 1B-like isoform X1 [Schistocerca gregaria]XP_049828199.1 protein phosphatase 1B-like isoform X1 [Schistocerca gregaria]
MGSFLDKPKTEKHNEHGCGNGLRYGVASMQGWRIEMEDAHCAVTGLGEGLEDWSFFAVFDGHAGERVSAHCADHLLECIVGAEEFRSDDVIEAIRAGFLRLDARMRALPELASGEDKSGSTAVCALISPHTVYVANCGDSRAVLCRSGSPTFSTRDHKPVLPAEKERIMRAGGSVMIQRVNGSLAVSRALGDYEYKNVEGRGPCEQLVSPEPEVSAVVRNEEKDEFLVLACDGVWDVMSNEDLCAFVRSRLALTDDLESVANQVVDTCLYKGSRDNMSIVLVTFPGVPQPSAEALQRERELEELIERRMTDIINQGDTVEFLHVLQTLADENIPGLPPGGGLSAKRNFIESVYKKLCPNNADSNSPESQRRGVSET